MNGKCLLVWLALAAAGNAAGELATPPAGQRATAEEVPGEQWQYHEKWDKVQQRSPLPTSKGAAPATDCRPPSGADRGTVRPAPLPGRCPDSGVRVRT